MYRKGDLSQTHDANQVNAAHEPQFEGVEFSDGRVAVRWLTAKASVSVWDSMDDLLAIHGHPEYDSELVWRSIEDEMRLPEPPPTPRMWLRKRDRGTEGVNVCRACEYAREAAFAGATHDLDRPPHTLEGGET